MPQVSKRKISKDIEQDLCNSFLYILKDLKNKKDLELFLGSVMTDTERVMTSKRILTAFLLNKGIEEKTIGETLKLTPSTVSRLKMWVKLHKDGFDLVFKKLNKMSNENLAKKVLYKILNYSINAAFGRSPKPFKSLTMH